MVPKRLAKANNTLSTKWARRPSAKALEMTPSAWVQQQPSPQLQKEISSGSNLEAFLGSEFASLKQQNADLLASNRFIIKVRTLCQRSINIRWYQKELFLS